MASKGTDVDGIEEETFCKETEAASRRSEIYEKVFWCLLLAHGIASWSSISEIYYPFVAFSDYQVPFHWLYFPYYMSYILPDSIHLLLQKALIIGMIPLVLLFPINNKINIIIIRISFFLCYMLYYSWNIYPHFPTFAPWDNILMELFVWSALVYPRPNKYGYNVLKYMLFRVVFGFGKLHYLGAWSEFDYVKTMLIWIPLPTTVGLWMYDNMPNIFWHGGHIITFIAEIIAPIIIMVNDNPNIKTDWYYKQSINLIIILMINILLVGNFGWFNTITILICGGLYLFNKQLQISKNDKQVGKKIFYYLFVFLSLPFLMSTSMNTFSLIFATKFVEIPIYSTMVQFMATHRLCNGFGGFGPLTVPAERWFSQWHVCVSNNSYNSNVNDYDNIDDCIWARRKLSTITNTTINMPDEALNVSDELNSNLISPPMYLSPWYFPRFEFITANYWEGLHVWDSPPSGLAGLGVNLWLLEAIPDYLCKNDSNVLKVKRNLAALEYSNGVFSYKIDPFMTHMWNCSGHGEINTPQSNKIVGIAEWDVRARFLLKMYPREELEDRGIFIWNENNLPYYDLVSGVGMADCLNHLHLVPSSWHPNYCHKLYKLTLYLNDCKKNNKTFKEIEPWAKKLLGKRGEMFYNDKVIWDFAVRMIEYYAPLEDQHNSDN